MARRARQRLPLEMIRSLAQETGQHIPRQAQPPWLWRGLSVKLVDGTTVTLPDTPENQAEYPQQRNQKPGLGFPIARWVGLLCATTGAVLDAAIGPYSGKTGSEHALFRELLGSIAAGDLILADRYYCAYFVIALLQLQGADVLFQQHQRRSTDFSKGRRLGSGDHVVFWPKPKICPSWLSREQFDAFPEALEVRELKVGHKVLVTTLLCAKQAPKKALGELYVSLWNVELDLRNLKTTLGLERLHCKTPEMNKKALWVGLLAYNLIRLLMAESAKTADVLPRLLSFKHSLQLWLAWSHSGPPDFDEEYLAVFFDLIAQQRVGNRPGRIEPRAVKRRAKPYPLLMKPRHQARNDVRRMGHPKKLK
ncbi:MAG: IS4 family transposase [Pseudomonadota bacterium]|nr:IS4 family transposase [Pseudomonadota bacterium]